MAFVAHVALYRAVERYFTDSLQEHARITFAHNTLQAAMTYLPFGSGLGTFVRVYQTVEQPADLLVNKFANHAHNDWLELALECGAAGLALVGVFVVWLVIQIVKAWGPETASQPDREALQQMAATLILVLLLLHSIVDYPLRTMTMMALMAFSVGLLIPPPPYKIAARAADEGLGAWGGLRSLRGDLSNLARRARSASRRTRTTPEPVTPARTEEPNEITSSHPITGYSDRRWLTPTPWPQEWAAPKSPPTETSRAPQKSEPVDFKSAWPSGASGTAAPKGEDEEVT